MSNKNEHDCRHVHLSIDEAIAHARENLGEGLTTPLWGTRGGRIANVGRVVGFQSNDGHRRFRLDFDPKKGVHVNEEDFTRPPALQKVVHIVVFSMTPMNAEAEQAWMRIMEGRMQLYWNKWTSRYNKPQEVIEAEREVDRQRKGG